MWNPFKPNIVFVMYYLCIQWIALYFSDENGPKRRYNIPVLSGTAYVGQLYDAKTDQLIPDQFLWKRSDMTILETGITNVFFETKIEESQMDRMNMMDIDASMKLSFMGGMVEVYIFEISIISYMSWNNVYIQNRYQDLQNIWAMRSFLMIG